MVPTTTPLQEAPGDDLEEGEICQQALVDCAALQPNTAVEVEKPQIVVEGHNQIEDQSAIVVVDDEISHFEGQNQIVVDFVISYFSAPSFGTSGVLVEDSTGCAMDDSVSDSPTIPNEARSEAGLVSESTGVNLNILTATEEVSSEVLLTEIISHSAEEQERDNHFIMVNNMKSGWKATKRYYNYYICFLRRMYED